MVKEVESEKNRAYWATDEILTFYGATCAILLLVGFIVAASLGAFVSYKLGCGVYAVCMGLCIVAGFVLIREIGKEWRMVGSEQDDMRAISRLSQTQCFSERDVFDQYNWAPERIHKAVMRAVERGWIEIDEELSGSFPRYRRVE